MQTTEPAEPAELQRGTDQPSSGNVSGTGGVNTASIGTRRYSVPQAARILGISERAVRKRIEADSLLAVREGRAWVVILEEPVGGVITAAAAEPSVTSAVVDDDNAVLPEPNTASTASVDLTPLVNLVADLTKRNAELTEAATIWQYHARQLEDQLKQLTPGAGAADDYADGQPAPEPPQDRDVGSGATIGDKPRDASAEPPRTERASWWRRLIFGE